MGRGVSGPGVEKETRMTLRRKILLVVAAALLGLVGVLYFASSSIVLSGFEELEEQQAADGVRRALEAVGRDVEGLDALANDWASWDDTYAYAQDGNAAYERSNLVPGTFASLNLRLLAIVDSEGRIVWGGAYDPHEDAVEALSADQRRLLGPGSPLVSLPSPTSSVSGVVALDDRPLMVAARPILTSREEGPPQGSLVMGRRLSFLTLRAYARSVGADLSVTLLDDAEAPPDVLRAEARLAEDTDVVVRPLNDERVAGYALLRDPAGEPVAVMRAAQARMVMARGIASQRYLLVSIVVVAAFFAAMGALLLERLVLRRLRRVAVQVKAIEEAPDSPRRIDATGSDELFDLTAGLNSMLDSLQRAQQDRRDLEDRYRAVVEQASDGILLFDPETMAIIRANEAYERMLGYTSEELTRLRVYDVVDSTQQDIDGRLSNLMEAGRLYLGERRHLRKDGSVIDVEVGASVVMVREKPMVCAVVRDLEPQREARAALRRREAILESVAFAAEQLLRRGAGAIPEVLAHLGQATRTSRVYVFETRGEASDMRVSQTHEWVAEGIQPQVDNPELQDVPLEGAGFGRWAAILSAAGVVEGPVRTFPPEERELLESQGIRSLAVVPIFAGDDWWGFIGFDDCWSERSWSSAELGALRAAAGTLGAAVDRVRSEEGRARAEARYRALVEQLPAIVYTAEFGDEGPWRYVSPRVETMLGFTPKEWMDDRGAWFKQLHPDDRERVLALEEESRRTGSPFSAEYRMLTKDGNVRWIRDEAVMILDESDEPVLQGVMYDVSEGKEAEAELRQHNEYLSALHETSLALMNRLEPSELLEAIVRRAAEIVGTEHGWVYLVEPDAEHLEFAVGIGLCTEFVGTRIAAGDGVAGSVWKSGEARVVENYSEWEGRIPSYPETIKSVAGVPLHSGDAVVGVIGLVRTEEGIGFTDTEVQLVSSFAELASIALDNARLYQAAMTEQERSRQLADAALEGICIHENGVIRETNRAFAAMFRYRPDELVGRSLLDLLEPGQHEGSLERLQGTGQQPVLTEALRKDGSRFHVEAVVRSIRWRGRSIGVAAVRDVTERKRAEEETRLLQEITAAMAEAEDFHRALEVGIREICETAGWVVGEAWVATGDGEGVERVAVWSSGEPKLQPFLDAGDQLRLAPGMGLAGRVFQERKPVWLRDVRTHPDFVRSEVAGQVGLRAATGVPVLAGDEVVACLAFYVFEQRAEDVRFGKIVSAVGAQIGAMVRRRRAEEAVRVAEEQYRGIFEHAAEGIFRMSPDGVFQSVNPSFARMLGYSSTEEALLEAPRDRYVFADEARRAASRVELDEEDSLTDYECEVRRRDGGTMWVSLNAQVILDEDGNQVAIEGTLLDITHRKAAEEGLRAAYEREREAAVRLRALDEMKNAFLTAVSHELRTPLSSILGFALTLTREDVELPAAHVREMVGRIAANARKLQRLLGDLLDLDRIARGILQPTRRPTDVGAVARSVVEEMELDQRPILVEAEPVLVEVDGPKVERIIENLVANAVKYTPPGTPVWVRVAAQADGVLLMVEDAGPGVPEEEREVIFEPFRQGDGAPEHAPGTGIGLSLVARFADLHGGRAWVEERKGGGASFRVFLMGTVSRRGEPVDEGTSAATGA